MRKSWTILALTVLVLFAVSFVSASSTTVDYNSNDKYSEAHFYVKTLKYEPFPVNAGEWFDLWVKVENIGQADAKDAEFTLIGSYPFEVMANESVRTFGIVPGVESAYKYKQAGDANTEANQVVMKFRVKVADNAPAGENIIKIKTATDKNSDSGVVYELPIDIEKTKTDFNVLLQDVSYSGISLVVSNVGDNPAKTVTLDVKNQDGIDFLQGKQPSALGDLGQGDLTVAHQNVLPRSNLQNINVEISYVDIAGITTTLEKTVPITNVQKVIFQESDKPYLKWIFGLVGFLAGAFVVILFFMQKKRRK